MTSAKETNYKNNVLVVGGGVAGLSAALDLAEQGYHVDLVEKSAELGGLVTVLHRLYPLCSCCKVVGRGLGCLQHPAISVLTESQLKAVTGEAGNFQCTVEGAKGSQQIQAGAIVLATGVEAFDPSPYDTYAHIKYPNVITSVEFEWLQKPNGPYQGVPKRPSDGQVPKRVAWLQCVGSREINRCDALYCSSVCCMYALKEATNMKELLPETDAAVFFMDMRTHGKGYEAYYNNAKENGVRMVRTRIHSIEKTGDDNMRLAYLDEAAVHHEEEFDMVVLSVGLRPSEEVVQLAKTLGVKLGEFDYFGTDDMKPAETNVPGVLVCGGAVGPRDVFQSVVEASAAAAKVGALLKTDGPSTGAPTAYRDVSGEAPAVGVVVSLCPTKAGPFEALADQLISYAESLPNVACAARLDLTNADAFQKLSDTIKEKNVNRLVYASCSPIIHKDRVEWAMANAGLNPTLYDFVDLRTLGSGAGEIGRLQDLVRAAVVQAGLLEPLKFTEVPVERSALVVGGGLAGMQAALALASQGVPVTLAEREAQLGGHGLNVRGTWRGESAQDILKDTVKQVQDNPSIEVLTGAQVLAAKGFAGNFTTTMQQNGDTRDIRHGVTILATGGKPLATSEYACGKHPGIHLWSDVSRKLVDDPNAFADVKCAVFIQCVGSREPERPYCSRLCCSFAVRNALDMKTRNPDADVYVLYRDIRTFGEREKIYKEARDKGVIFIRFSVDQKPVVEVNGDALEVTVVDPILAQPVILSPDFISLQTAVIPREAAAVAAMYKVSLTEDGFFQESPAKLRPLDGETEGIFFAGLAAGPKGTEESLAEAWAVTARAMKILSRETMMVGGAVAEVNPDLCAVCLTCVRTCPFGVPFIDPAQGAAFIDPGLCQGCGMCTSECPGKAIAFKRLGDDHISTVVQSLLQRAAG